MANINISSAALRYAMSIADMPNTPPMSPRLAPTPRGTAAAPAPPPDTPPPAAQWHLQRSPDVFTAFAAGGGMPPKRSWQDAPVVHLPVLHSPPPLPVQGPDPRHSTHGPAKRLGPTTEAAKATAVWRITATAEAAKRCVRRVQCAGLAPSDLCSHAPARAHTQAHMRMHERPGSSTLNGAASIAAVEGDAPATETATRSARAVTAEGLAETAMTNAFVQQRLADQIKLQQQYDHDRAQGRLGSTATLDSVVITYPQENSHSDTPPGAYYHDFPMSSQQFEIENIGPVFAGDASTHFDYAELATSCATLAAMRATYRVSAPTPKRYNVSAYLTDVESNLEYFERYVEISQILGWADQKKSKLKFKRDDAVFVYGGDTQDKGIGDIRFVKLLLALKEEHPDRVEFIIGNCAGFW